MEEEVMVSVVIIFFGILTIKGDLFMESPSSREKELIRDSLIIRRNMIETGDPSLSREDAQSILNSQKGQERFGQMKVKIKVLSDEQKELVSELNN